MSAFVEELAERSRKESKVRAVLKRSLAFEPGTYPAAFPYVEHRLKNDDGEWKRKVYYLVAGVWAMNRRGEGGEYPQFFAGACRSFYWTHEESPSMERRFINLLDADEDQLPHRLRQMVALLKEYDIDFNQLLKDLLYWNHPDKFVQIKWAKEFYRVSSEEVDETETINSKESES